MLDELDRRIIARCCEDIGDDLYPFARMATELDISEDQLIVRIDGYRAQGMLRRFGAILRHQTAGFTVNGMSVWDVPDDAVERIGSGIARYPEVTHCYQRPRFPGWPYNLYAMIHTQTEETCRVLVEEIARVHGLTQYQILFSTHEYKKTSMRYFTR